MEVPLMTEQEYAKVIAKNLKRIAYESGKTQVEIARDLSINPATLSSWMTGTRTPKMSKIDMLCDYFKCKREDIMEVHADNFRFAGWVKTLSESDIELIKAYKDAPEGRKEAVRALLGL